jgi:DNA repair exonuclease SbcCD nuclease subunit
MPLLLHTADWQIGRTYASFPPENAHPLAEARLAAVERLAALATAEGVDAVLVAGDVFDAQTVSDRTLRRLFNALAGFTGPWLLLPGNHDAALAESVWTRAQRLRAVPPHAHLLLRPEPWIDAGRGLAVLPAPLTQRHTHGDLTAWFDAADTPAGLARIGLAHGSVQGLLAEDLDATNPIAPDRAERARLDYLALGDWHGAKRIGPRCSYSGTPETDRFRNNDSGQALLVQVAPGAEPVLRALPVGRYRWRQLEQALQVPSDLDELVATLATLGADDVLELTLTGRLDLAGQQRLAEALARAEASARHLQTDRAGLSLQPTDEDLAALQADGYLGEVIGELRSAQAAGGADGAVAQEALALLCSALAQRRPATSVGVSEEAR